MTNQHVPDATRLPACVSGWKSVSDDAIYLDGSQLLVALPLQNNRVFDPCDTSWHYSFHVVTVRCDEHFDLEDSTGEPFPWSIADVDFYVELVR